MSLSERFSGIMQRLDAALGCHEHTGGQDVSAQKHQQEAFERLRGQARARRTRLEDFAGQLLRMADEAGSFYRSLGTADAPRRGTGEKGGAAYGERANG